MLHLILLWVFAPLTVLTQTATSSATQLLYQFENTTALENIAVRPNGHLLVTVSNKPLLYSIDPHTPSPSPEVVYSFPDLVSSIGIHEIAPDVFAVATGNFSSISNAVKGSFRVWSIDFNLPHPDGRLIASLDEADSLNGMTGVPGVPHNVLISDSLLGAIWSLDVATSEYGIAIQDPLFSPTPVFPLGINGIRASSDSVYFTNSARNTFGRVPFNLNGKAAGAPEVIATASRGTVAFDDFAFSESGYAWITAHPNALTVVSPGGGSQRNVTGEGQTDFLELTSVAFGKGCDKDILYVVTAGAQAGDGLQGYGQVLAVNTTAV